VMVGRVAAAAAAAAMLMEDATPRNKIDILGHHLDLVGRPASAQKQQQQQSIVN
jgi:hypothetical protein